LILVLGALRGWAEEVRGGVLAWIPCADEDEEYAHVVEALGFRPQETRTRSASELRALLAGIGVLLIPEQEECSESSLASLGSDCGSVLREFLDRGGTIVGMSYAKGAEDILRGAGILPGVNDDEGITGETVRVAVPSHPLAAGVASSFKAENGTTDFSGVSAAATVIVKDADGDPVVFVQAVGRGTVIMLGFDFYEYNADMARLLRNAVGPAQITQQVTRIAVLDESREPSYFTGGVSNSYSAVLDIARARGLAAERITSADIAAGKLDGFTTLVLPDNAPPVEVVERIVAWWARGNHIIAIDSGITFVLYSGILFPELKGRPAGESKPAYWTYDSSSTIVIRKSQPITAGYSPGQELSAESGDALLVIAKLPSGAEVLAVDKAKPDQAAIVFYQAAGTLTFIGPDEDAYYLKTIIGNAMAFPTRGVVAPGGVLAWIPCADEDEEYAHVVEALGFRPQETRTRSASELRALLAGIGVLLIPEQEECSESSLASLGSDCGSVLREFLDRGGTIVGMSYAKGAEDILRGAGILPGVNDDEDITGETVRVAVPSHPLAAGVASSFKAENGTTDFSGVSAAATVIVKDADGDPVVFVQAVGRGTVVMLGFDFYQYNSDMAQLLRNAVSLSRRLVLLLQDAAPWDDDVNPRVLKDLGIPFEPKTSADLSGLNLMRYGLVIISSDQPQRFYDTLAGHIAGLESYVRNGGILLFLAADDGWNDGRIRFALPGGITVTHQTSDPNRVRDPAHPIVRGVPGSFAGDWASHVYFGSLPTGTRVITVDDQERPTTIEYRLGSGVVIATGVTVEWAVKRGHEYKEMLANMIRYAWDLAR
jgi:cytochrome oxidase Cu insertion factor (SCO1/SenC/PrrC family)